MKKFTMETKLGEALTDNRAFEIIKRNLPFVMNHPRFTEALEYSLEEIINDRNCKEKNKENNGRNRRIGS